MDQLTPYITQILVLLITVVLGYFGVQQKAQTDTQKAGLTLAQQQAAVDFLHRVVPIAVRSAEQLFGLTPGQGAIKERYVRDTVKALVGDTVDPLELTTLIQAAVLALPSAPKPAVSGASLQGMVAQVSDHLPPADLPPPASAIALATGPLPPIAGSIYAPQNFPQPTALSNGTAGDTPAEPVASGATVDG